MTEVAVYWIHSDVRAFRSLLFDLPEIPEESVFFHTISKRDSWPTPPVCLDDYLAPNPDIWDLSAGTTIAMTPQTIERLEPFISRSSEILPLENRTGEKLELFALNVVNEIDLKRCMDLTVGAKQRRRLVQEAAANFPADAEELLQGLERGDPWRVLYPAFTPACLRKPELFTVLGKILCVEREDCDDSVMQRVEQFQMTGLAFTKVWTNLTGPEPINLFRP